MDVLQAVIFSLNGRICGADASQVREIIKYKDVANTPKQPKFAEGFINLRGNAVPVVNLNKRFGLGDSADAKKAKVIITDVDGKQIGFAVNDVLEITKFAGNDVEPPPKAVCNPANAFLKLIAKRGEKLVSILDLEKILTDREIKRLDDFMQ